MLVGVLVFSTCRHVIPIDTGWAMTGVGVTILLLECIFCVCDCNVTLLVHWH